MWKKICASWLHFFGFSLSIPCLPHSWVENNSWTCACWTLIEAPCWFFPPKCECNIQELGLLLFIYSIYCRGLPSCLPYGSAYKREANKHLPTNHSDRSWCLKLKYLLFSVLFFMFSVPPCMFILLWCNSVFLVWNPQQCFHMNAHFKHAFSHRMVKIPLKPLFSISCLCEDRLRYAVCSWFSSFSA